MWLKVVFHIHLLYIGTTQIKSDAQLNLALVRARLELTSILLFHSLLYLKIVATPLAKHLSLTYF